MAFPSLLGAQIGSGAHVPSGAHVYSAGLAVDWPLFTTEWTPDNDVVDGDPFDDFLRPLGTTLTRTSSGALWFVNSDWQTDGRGRVCSIEPLRKIVLSDSWRDTIVNEAVVGRVPLIGNPYTAPVGAWSRSNTASHYPNGDGLGVEQAARGTAGTNILVSDVGTPDGKFYSQPTSAVGCVCRLVDAANYIGVRNSAGVNAMEVFTRTAGVNTVIATGPAGIRGSYSAVILAGRRIQVWVGAINLVGGLPSGNENRGAGTIVLAWQKAIDYTMSYGEWITTAFATKFGSSDTTITEFQFAADQPSEALVQGPSSGTISISFDALQAGDALVFRSDVGGYNHWRVEQRNDPVDTLALVKRVNDVSTDVATVARTMYGRGLRVTNSITNGGALGTWGYWTRSDDLHVEVDATLDNWGVGSGGLVSPMAWQWPGGGSWALYLYQGTIGLAWVDAGGSTHFWSTATAVTSAWPSKSRHRIKLIFDVDNGASGYTVSVYESVDNRRSWTLLGTSTVAGVTTIAKSQSPFNVNGAVLGSTDGWAGCVHQAEVRDGIDGPIRVALDADKHNAGLTTWVSDYGNTWTCAGAAVIVEDKITVTLAADSISVAHNSSAGVLATTDAALQTNYLCGMRQKRTNQQGLMSRFTTELAWVAATTHDTRSDSLAITRGIPVDVGTVDPGTIRQTMHNRTRKWDPLNTAGPYYGKLLRWRRLRERYRLLDGVDRPLAHGFIDKYPQDWPVHGIDMQTPLEITDATGLARLTKLRNPITDMLLMSRPVVLVPLDDLDATRAAMNIAPGGLAVGVIGNSSTQSGTIVNGEAPGLEYVAPQLSVDGAAFPNGRGSFGIHMLMDIPPDAGAVGTLMTWYTSDPASGGTTLQTTVKITNPSGHAIQLLEQCIVAPGADRSVVTALADASPRALHSVFLQQDATANNVKVWVDGVLVTDQFVASTLLDLNYVDTIHVIPGSLPKIAVSKFTVYRDVIHTDAQVKAIASAAALHLAGQTSDQRMHTVLDSMLGTSRRTIPVCTKQLTHATITGVDDLSVIANGERGIPFADDDSTIRLRPRSELAAQPVAGEWGNQATRVGKTAAVEFDVLQPLVSVTVTRAGTTASGASLTDVISVQPGVNRPIADLSIPTVLLLDADAMTLGQDWLTARAVQQTLVRAITIQPRAGNQWAWVLGLKLGSLVRFAAIPLAKPGSPLVDITAMVSHMSHQMQGVGGLTTTLEVMFI